MVDARDLNGVVDVVEDILDGREVFQRPVPALAQMFDGDAEVQVLDHGNPFEEGAADGPEFLGGLVVALGKKGELEDDPDHSAVLRQSLEHLVADVPAVGVDGPAS